MGGLGRSNKINHDILIMLLELRNNTKNRFGELKCLWKIHERLKDYPDKEKLLDGYTHDNDMYILVDAHDLSLTISPHPLIFLTLDNGIYDNRLEILKHLSIYDIRDLKRESAT
jgi:hypothetical protein